MNTFTIKDLESLSGIKAHTIRIWEQRYSFLRPQRTDTNIRYYSNEELKKVLNIALLNKYGFKISHIDKMTADEIQNKLVSLTDSQAQQERMVNRLVQHMVDMDIEAFEEDLDHFISLKGIDKAINNLLFPFLEKIGILWQTNHINPAQEHLVTNIIRQKLVVGIDRASSSISVNKTILLFLPEGEYHELGILYVYYLLKSRGVGVLYLGANVPLKDVEYVIKLKNPDQLYTHLSYSAGNNKVERFLTQLHQDIPNLPIIVSGNPAGVLQRKISKGVQFKKSLAEVMEHISNL